MRLSIHTLSTSIQQKQHIKSILWDSYGHTSGNRLAPPSHILAVLLGLALCIGVVTASVTAGLPAFLPMLFTPDRRLWPLMRTVAPQVRSIPCA